MFCTKCGNRMPDGSKFCTKCGAPMGGEADPSSTPPKKKRTGLVAGVTAAVVVALAAVGIAVANPFAAPEPEPAPV